MVYSEFFSLPIVFGVQSKVHKAEIEWYFIRLISSIAFVGWPFTMFLSHMVLYTSSQEANARRKERSQETFNGQILRKLSFLIRLQSIPSYLT